jgi:hypothetical protein
LKDTKEVFAIATPPPEENSFNVQSFDELRGLDQKIFSSICPGILIYVFILHLFYLSSQIALTILILVIYGHWPRYSFSGRATAMNSNRISADVVEATIENN